MLGVLIVAGAVAGGDEGDGDDEVVAADATTSTVTPATFAAITLDEAVDRAAAVAPSGLDDATLEDLIEAACEGLIDGDADEVAAEVGEELADTVPADFADGAEAVGAGVEALCPEGVEAAPDFLNAVVATARQAATTTSTTTTTAPPPPPTTAAPPPPPPPPAPTTAAPPANVYYENCTAARAAGAAPVHRGEPGYGSHLDRDGDGVGCES